MIEVSIALDGEKPTRTERENIRLLKRRWPELWRVVFAALEEQLGLKLVPAKNQIEVFVIRHIERPSEN